MHELALFAGAGGGILGGKLLGFRTVCAVERDEAARDVLISRQNDGVLDAFPIWDDIRTFDGSRWRGVVDVVSGGFPCQCYSTAARGRNNAPDLWPEMRRVVADVAPRFVLAENVSRKAIDRAADDLEEMGYKTRGVALSAKDLGADHVRERFWLCAYANSNRQLPLQVDAEMAELQKFQTRVWEAFPGSSRMVDGMASGVDKNRLRLTGNGQVPAVVVVAWGILTKGLL